MTERNEPPEVEEDQAGSRFVAGRGDSEAELVYRLRGKRMVLVHTEVPESLRGLGIGGRLVRAAVERAAREGLTIVPLCPYARGWLEEHPDQAGSVAIDWGHGPSDGKQEADVNNPGGKDG